MDIPSSIVGVWKLKSLSFEETASGNVLLPFGEAPKGLIVFTKGGHMMALGVEAGRKPPSSSELTESERAALFSSMFAYSGVYRIEEAAAVTEVEISWNETWTGTKQIRFAEIADNKLHLKSAPFLSPQTGREVIGMATWERVE